jgi:hypothetical protein
MTALLPPPNQPVFRFWGNSDLLGRKLLRYEPLGTDQLAISLHRDPKTHGMATEYTAQLSFVKDGRAYVQRAYDAAGIEADVHITAEQLDPNAFEWRPYYTGRVNYTAAEFTATQVKVNLEQSNFQQKFLARSSVQVDLLSGTSVSGAVGPTPAPQLVSLHSRALVQHYAATQKNTSRVSAQMFGDDGDPSHEQLLFFGFDTPERNELGLGAVAGGFVAGDSATAAPIYTAKENGPFTLDLALFAHIEAHTSEGLFMRQFTKVGSSTFLRVDGSNPQVIELQPEIAVGNLDGDYAGDINVPATSYTFNLKVGDSLYLYAPWFVHDLTKNAPDPYQAIISADFKPGSFLRITATTQTDPTDTTGLFVYEGLERLTQALTDEVDVFRSDFFGRTDSSLPYPIDGPGSLALLTGGFQVRGFPLRSAPAPVAPALDLRKSLVTTWGEAYDSLAATYNLGYGLEWVVGRRGDLQQVIRVEHFSWFYPADVVLDLTALGPLPLTTHVAGDYHYQVAELGYEQWESQQAGGLDEFNAQRQWTTPLTQSENKYTQISKFSTSGVLLEATRRDRYDVKATTDTSNDATNFLVCLLRTPAGFETERDQLATQLSGVGSPATVYNLRVSPGRMLRRHGPQLAAGLKATATATVRATGGSGNGTVVSQLLGEAGPVIENGDVLVRELPAPLWLPHQYELKAVPVSREQLRALLARPTGRVRFLDDHGQPTEGWVLDFKHAGRDESGDFTLLACATLSHR